MLYPIDLRPTPEERDRYFLDADEFRKQTVCSFPPVAPWMPERSADGAKRRGYYSLMQFCPNAARMEAVNVGVVLLVPDLGFLDVKTDGSSKRAERMFGAHRDLSRLFSDVMAMRNRLYQLRDEMRSMADFNAFVETRANSIVLTEPRSLVARYPSHTLLELMRDLVCEPERPNGPVVVLRNVGEIEEGPGGISG